MSDAQLNQNHASANGATAGSTATGKKRKVATSSVVDGHTAQLQFSADYNNAVITVDVRKIPGGNAVTDAAANVLAYGVNTLLQGAYNAADGDPVVAAQEMAGKILRGAWQPGYTRRNGPAEPDELLQALAQHLKTTVENIEDKFLPGYSKKHDLPNVAAAKRRLRRHVDIAPLIAAIEAERAKRIAASVKGQPRETLDL